MLTAAVCVNFSLFVCYLTTIAIVVLCPGGVEGGVPSARAGPQETQPQAQGERGDPVRVRHGQRQGRRGGLGDGQVVQAVAKLIKAQVAAPAKEKNDRKALEEKLLEPLDSNAGE